MRQILNLYHRQLVVKEWLLLYRKAFVAMKIRPGKDFKKTSEEGSCG
jgi:hypothetical protein